jgi:hypothetical protein
MSNQRDLLSRAVGASVCGVSSPCAWAPRWRPHKTGSRSSSGSSPAPPRSPRRNISRKGVGEGHFARHMASHHHRHIITSSPPHQHPQVIVLRHHDPRASPPLGSRAHLSEVGDVHAAAAPLLHQQVALQRQRPLRRQDHQHLHTESRLEATTVSHPTSHFQNMLGAAGPASQARPQAAPEHATMVRHSAGITSIEHKDRATMVDARTDHEEHDEHRVDGRHEGHHHHERVHVVLPECQHTRRRSASSKHPSNRLEIPRDEKPSPVCF